MRKRAPRDDRGGGTTKGEILIDGGYDNIVEAKGENVVIVGGGNTAQQEAVLLAGYCKSVTMVQNLGKLTGEASGIDLINKTENIILPFKYGAVKMAKETNSYIVPFSITNKYLNKTFLIERSNKNKLY